MTILLLAACGGGGGGGSAPTTAATPPATPAQPALAPAPANRAVLETDRTLARIYQETLPPASAPSMSQAAVIAATATPVLGSLHMSSTGNAPVALGTISLEEAHMTIGPEQGRSAGSGVQTLHYFDQSITVDYDGDGAANYKLTVANDSYIEPRIAERGNCSVITGSTAMDGGNCTAWVGSPDNFMILVHRQWTRAGVIDNSERDFDVTKGWWHDSDAGHVGVFWTGPSIDNPHPLDQPIDGAAQIVATGHAFLDDGTLVQAQANGEIAMNLNGVDSTVTLDLGKPKQAHNTTGITLVNLNEYDAYRTDDPQIEQIFRFEESYDPDSPYFGTGDQQRSTKNDVVSGNARGQFAGVITKRPNSVQGGADLMVPAVFGTLGLTDIAELEGNLAGLSLIMGFESGPFCALDARQSGCR